MDSVIRDAVVDRERRQLVRRHTAPAVPVSASEAPANPTFAAGASIDRTDEIKRLKHQLEEQLVLAKRQLEDDRIQLRKTAETTQSAAAQEAAERGYREGLIKGENQGRAQLEDEVARARLLAEDLRLARENALSDVEDDMVEIAFSAICRLVGSAAVTREVALHAVRSAASDLSPVDVLRVAVHPDEAAWISTQLAACRGVEVTPSASVILGGCQIESTRGTLDARLETQLGQLRGALNAVRNAHLSGEVE